MSLPYWDTRLDHNMDNPANSIIWSSKFLGNANGDVITGPFARWKSPRGNIWREYGSHPRGKLISDKTIKNILTRCKTDVSLNFLTTLMFTKQILISIRKKMRY